jgi:hypothetical protein
VSTDALVNGTHYYASQTVSGCESASRLDVTVTITDPSTPSGNASQSFCVSDGATVADLSASGSGTLTWYDAPTGGTAYVSTDALVNGTHYYASQTISGCESSSRLDVTVTITDPSAPSGNASQSFCVSDGATVADLSASGSGTLTWYDAPTGGTAYVSTDALVNGTHYYASQTVSGCESSSRLDVTVTITDPSTPSGDASQSFCAESNPTVFDLEILETSLNYYDELGNPLAITSSLTDGFTYFVTNVVSGCESSDTLAVTVDLVTISIQLDSVINTICNTSTGSAYVSASGGNSPYQYLYSNGTTSSFAGGLSVGEYQVSVTDANGCVGNLSFEMNCSIQFVPQFLSLGGGGNDVWIIHAEPQAEIKIFNRWGNLVFSASPYLDDFDGHSNVGGVMGDDYLPSGTYYYIIDHKNGESPEVGYIEIVN